MLQQVLNWQYRLPQLANPKLGNICLPLEMNKVDVWQANLSLDGLVLQELQNTLSEDEKCRADHFYFPEDKNYYIAARGILRSILARYLRTKPELIKFTYTPQGKPYLEKHTRKNSPEYTNKCIQFNLSHSQNLALYALAIDQPLGIDLEYCRPLPDALALAKRWFLPTEYQELLAQTNQELNFFRIWTAKEAYLKATGVGLRDLATVEVMITPENSLQYKTIQGSKELAQQWSLLELNPTPNYAAALAISQPYKNSL